MPAINLDAREELLKAFSEGIKRAKARAKAYLELSKKYPEVSKEELETVVDEERKRFLHNFYLRERRFREKIFPNAWTHLITVTRNDALWKDEQSFRDSVEKCFCNLKTRRGWKIIWVWEEGELNERLHAHAFVYVPPGQMVCEPGNDPIVACHSWSEKRHKYETTQLSSWFTSRYGRTEFEELDQARKGYWANYIIKYLLKSGEKIHYSRGIVGEVCKELAEVRDVMLQYKSHGSVEAILRDDVVDWSELVSNGYSNKHGELVRESLRCGGSPGEALEKFRAHLDGRPPTVMPLPKPHARERQIEALERITAAINAKLEAKAAAQQQFEVKAGVQLACI